LQLVFLHIVPVIGMIISIAVGVFFSLYEYEMVCFEPFRHHCMLCSSIRFDTVVVFVFLRLVRQRRHYGWIPGPSSFVPDIIPHT
jgi:hypothetical protein